MKRLHTIDCWGVTLIELVVAMAIMALVSGLAGGTFFHWLPRYRLKRAATDLFATLQRAKMLAVRNGGECAVVFDADVGTYYLVSSGADRRYDGRDSTGDDRVEKRVRLSDYGSGIAFGHGDAVCNATTRSDSGFPADHVSFAGNTALFTGEGMTRRMGYVYLANDHNGTVAVAAPTMAGTVRLLGWDGERWR
jgi:prepilin-type N-terminal cleavage/methylation domain-containing protein